MLCKQAIIKWKGKKSFDVNDVQTKQKNIKSTPTEKYQSSVKNSTDIFVYFLR